MEDARVDADPLLEPDVSHLVTEDDTPVDSVFSEKQMRLLTSARERRLLARLRESGLDEPER